MVAYKELKASNSLINDATAPQVSVFVGGTSGIGKMTVKALVATGASLKIYLVGRKSSAEPMQAFIKELAAINPKAEVIWTEGEIALLAEVKRVCEVIKSKEARVDLLYMTPGYCPFGARKETAEGIEPAQSLEYYGRIVFINHLLPVLNAAEAPRVVSVLGGGLESLRVNVDDPGLKKPGNFSGVVAQMQYLTMHTLGLEKLVAANPDITFVHSWPGVVSTGNVRRGVEPNSIMDWVSYFIMIPILNLLTASDELTEQRYLFQCTSALYGGKGIPWKGKPGVNSMNEQANGLFLLDYKCDCTPNAKVMPRLREVAQEKIWNHTQEVVGPYL